MGNFIDFDALRHCRVEKTGAVNMDGHAVPVGHFADRRQSIQGIAGPACPVVSIFQTDQRAARLMNIHRTD